MPLVSASPSRGSEGLSQILGHKKIQASRRSGQPPHHWVLPRSWLGRDWRKRAALESSKWQRKEHLPSGKNQEFWVFIHTTFKAKLLHGQENKKQKSYVRLELCQWHFSLFSTSSHSTIHNLILFIKIMFYISLSLQYRSVKSTLGLIHVRTVP